MDKKNLTTSTNDTSMTIVPRMNATLFEGYFWSTFHCVSSDKTKSDVPDENISNPSSIYIERILACLVYAVQSEIAGIPISNVSILPASLKDYRRVKIPINVLLHEDDTSHINNVKSALTKLQSIVVPYAITNKNDRIVGYKYRSLIVESEIDNGLISFMVGPEIWRSIIDFSKGFRKTEFWVVRALKNPISYRLYKLMSKQNNPIKYSVKEFSDIFNLCPSYRNNPANIKKRVLDVCKTELDNIAPWSFEYSFEQSSEEKGKHRVGPKSYDIIVLTPVYHRRNERLYDNLKVDTKSKTIFDLIKVDTLHYLMEVYGFNAQELNNNREILLFAQEKIGFDEFFDFVRSLRKKVESAATNKKSYLITCIRNFVES